MQSSSAVQEGKKKPALQSLGLPWWLDKCEDYWLCRETNSSYKEFGPKPLEDPPPKQDDSNKGIIPPLFMGRRVETTQWEDYPPLVQF